MGISPVGIDYHVEVSGFFYSAPHALIRQQVQTRVTERTVEVFPRGRRVAAAPDAMAVPARHLTACRVRISYGMPDGIVEIRTSVAAKSASSTSFNSSPVLIAPTELPLSSYRSRRSAWIRGTHASFCRQAVLSSPATADPQIRRRPATQRPVDLGCPR